MKNTIENAQEYVNEHGEFEGLGLINYEQLMMAYATSVSREQLIEFYNFLFPVSKEVDPETVNRTIDLFLNNPFTPKQS
jgi:hypothetical protein